MHSTLPSHRDTTRVHSTAPASTLLIRLNMCACEVCPSRGTRSESINEIIAGVWWAVSLTRVISRLAAAADMCRDGCLTELLQSRARANVPTDLETTRNWSIFLSFKLWCGVHMSVSSSSMILSSVSPSFSRCCRSVWYRLPTRISPLSAKRVFWVGSKTRQ